MKSKAPLLLALFLLPVLQASAALLASYSTSSGPEAGDPTTQGWSVSGNYSDNPPIPPKAGSEVIGGREWRFWDISNVGERSNYSALYRHNILAKDFNAPDGWTATAVLRVKSAATSFNSTFLQISDGKHSWEVSFINNPADGSSINYHSTASSGITPLSAFDTAADFFTIQLYYDPLDASVRFFLNGTQIGDAISGADVPTAAANQLYVRWGDNQGGPTAVRTSAQWNEVRLETGYAVIPEPRSLALLFGSGILMLRAFSASGTKR